MPVKTSRTTKTFPKVQPKTSPKSLVNGPDPVKAAAVAAGARIATPSAAAAILKQQLKSAIHIKPGFTNFRDVHSPNTSRPHDQNANAGPLNPVSTATQETSGVTISSSAKLPKEDQEAQAAVSAKVQDTSKKEVVKENAGLLVEPGIMDKCENESTKEV